MKRPSLLSTMLQMMNVPVRYWHRSIPPVVEMTLTFELPVVPTGADQTGKAKEPVIYSFGEYRGQMELTQGEAIVRGRGG